MHLSIHTTEPSGRLAISGYGVYRHGTHNPQNPAVNIPLDIVAQVAGWLDSGSDLTSMALVQQSWCYPAQIELFGTVVLKCPIRAQLFVEAFIRNIGPGNPLKRIGIGRLRLECFVHHIYVDIPCNYSQRQFYGNIITVLPLLSNLRSLYIMMRRWDKYIWELELGKFLPEHAPRSLVRLCIQVSEYCKVKTNGYLCRILDASWGPGCSAIRKAAKRWPVEG